jgi:hypothetical protein
VSRLDTHERRRLQTELEIAVLQYAIDDEAEDILDFGVAMFWAAAPGRGCRQ